MSTFEAVVLAIVEGLTEYLPISSTGHMILVSWFLGIPESELVKSYTVIVQFGAILAVLFLFWRQFLKSFRFYLVLGLGVVPAGVLGLLFEKSVDRLLGSVTTVGVTLLLGGIVLLKIDQWLANRIGKDDHGLQGVSIKKSIQIGFFQALALIPGTSRSASTIVGGMFLGLNRVTAAEFSFLLAVPTLTAAAALKTYKHWDIIQQGSTSLFLVGNLISFIVGYLSIRGFVRLLKTKGFAVFGWYRIAVGLIVLAIEFYQKS